MKLEIILDRSFKIIFLSIPDDESDFFSGSDYITGFLTILSP